MGFPALVIPHTLCGLGAVARIGRIVVGNIVLKEMPQLAVRVRYCVRFRASTCAVADTLCRFGSVLFAGGIVVRNIRLPCKAVIQGGDILGICMGGAGTGVSPLMLPPDACQFAAGMYRIAPLSFLHLFSFSAHITPEKERFGELLSKLPIKFGNKAKSAFLPYSCLDIIQLGMKKGRR